MNIVKINLNIKVYNGHIYIRLYGLGRLKKDAVIIQGVDKAHPFARFL